VYKIPGESPTAVYDCYVTADAKTTNGLPP
jgi:hypothetical protein